MEDFKLLLIDRLKSKGINPALIPAFLKTLTHLISSEPGIDPAVANQKMHSLGWNEVTVDVSAATEKDGNLTGFGRERRGKDKGARARSLARS